MAENLNTQNTAAGAVSLVKPANVTEFMVEVVKLSQQMNDQTQIVADSAHGMATRLANGVQAVAKYNASVLEILDYQEKRLIELEGLATAALVEHQSLIKQLSAAFEDQITELNAMAGLPNG